MEFLTPDVELYISKDRESGFNIPPTTGPSFLRFTSQNSQIFLPEMEKSDDAGRAGNASEFATAQCNEWWLPGAFSLTDRVNFDPVARLFLRGAGGGVVGPTVVVGGAAWKYAASLLPKASGLQLPTTSVISSIGGASYLCPGGIVSRFRMFQDGGNPVQCELDVLTSGKHKSPHGIGTPELLTITAAGTVTTAGNVTVTITARDLPNSPIILQVPVALSDAPATWAQKVRDALNANNIIAGFFVVGGASATITLTTRFIVVNDTTMSIALANGTSAGITPGSSTITTPSLVTLPGVPSFSCLDSNSIVQYTDDIGLQDLTQGCRIRNWSCEVNNNPSPNDDRCIGAPKQIEDDYTITAGPGLAKYLSKISRGPRTITSSVVYLLDSVVPQRIKMARNILLTNLTFGARGAVLDGAGPTYETLSIIIAKAWISTITGQDSSGKAALTLNFKASYDTSDVAARVEVVNGQSTGVN